MILSFGSKESEKVWNGVRVKKWPLEIQTVGRRKLRMLHNSQNIADLRIPPSNRLEKLSGNLKIYTASELTISGELFSSGKMEMLTKLKLSIITKNE